MKDAEKLKSRLQVNTFSENNLQRCCELFQMNEKRSLRGLGLRGGICRLTRVAPQLRRAFTTEAKPCHTRGFA